MVHEAVDSTRAALQDDTTDYRCSSVEREVECTGEGSRKTKTSWHLKDEIIKL